MVKEQALASLKRVMEFKQAQFDMQRQAFKEALEQQKSVEELQKSQADGQ